MKPLVSICCIAYNQENYIAQTLESFLMQRTDFEFEILIHDDASTDLTATIIEAYRREFPLLIKPIYQTVNQYSQGIEVDYVYNFMRASGTYIAYSEGDDYWTDPEKLQKQVTFMEDHPEVSVCFHADKTINEHGDRIIGYRQAFPTDHYLSIEEAIHLDGKFAQNSFLFRTEHIQQLPHWYFEAPVSDYPLLLFLALKGRVYYMNTVMSAYRRSSINSWTRTVYQVADKRKKHYESLEKMLHAFDHDTGYQYTKAVAQQIESDAFTLLRCEKNIKTMKTELFKEHYNQLSVTEKGRLYLAHYLPFTMKLNDWLKDSGNLYRLKEKELFPLKERN